MTKPIDTGDDVLGLPLAGSNVSIYPNPASGHFILKGGAEQVSGVTLISTSGKAVRHYPAARDGMYGISGLDEGIFLVVIEAGGERKHAGSPVIKEVKAIISKPFTTVFTYPHPTSDFLILCYQTP